MSSLSTIPSIQDSAVVQDREGDGQIVYLFLPFYRVSQLSPTSISIVILCSLCATKRGNLQDIITANSLSGTHLPEKEMMQLFRGTCLGVRAMHDYHVPAASSSKQTSSSSSSRKPAPHPHRGGGEDEDGEHESHGLLPHPHSSHDDDTTAPDDDGEGEGYTYPSGGSIPLVADRMKEQTGEVVFDGDEELASMEPPTKGRGEHVPYAHRDLKPASVSHVFSLTCAGR